MSSLTPVDGTIESAMKASASAIRFRLMHGSTPAPKAPRPRPVSPFVLEIRARREEAARREAEFQAHRAKARANRENSGPHWSRIIAQVVRKHGLRASDILEPSRYQRVVMARNEAFYRMRTEILVGGAPMSFPAIGRRFGGMDHTTVLHGFRKHAALIGADVSPDINTIHRHQNKTGVAPGKTSIAP